MTELNVTLVDYTGAGTADPARHAANLLVFTKQTRLEMRPGLLHDIESWSWEEIERELSYMSNTIPSSWEFVTYTFLINNVTRAFTHQLVRTRTGSYAQQTMRVLNVEGWTYGTGPSIQRDPVLQERYDGTMAKVAEAYDDLIAQDAAIEDARGVLPTNIHTNIVAKFDLRNLVSTMRKRASGRTQGEYRSVLDAMRAEITRVHPWTEMFLERTFDRAAADLEEWVRMNAAHDEVIDVVKLIDQMRGEAS